MVTLLVATTTDPASIGPASALLAMPGWHPGPSLQDSVSFVNKEVRLIKLDTSLVKEDHLDKRWEEATGELVDEVIFLSKHVASSNRPALTVHPIGTPHIGEGEVLVAGGKPGWAAPPNPRIGPWLRLLRTIAESHKLTPEFEVVCMIENYLCSEKKSVDLPTFNILRDIFKALSYLDVEHERLKMVTLEATHHGPLTNSPTMFVEIGSTEEHWRRQDAAQAIALLVWQGLGLGGGIAEGDWGRNGGSNKILLGIGGGHYVPRHMDIVLKDGVWVGHLLSGYSLPMEDPGQSKTQLNTEAVHGTWREAIKVAFEATKSAFPGGEILAHLDHKSFKSWQRNAVTTFLVEQNIKIGKISDFS